MKKFSKKGVLLFAAAMAFCAFAMPSMASASSWGPLPSEHTLDSTDFGFIGHGGGGVSSMCSSTSFTVDVVSTAVIEITTASFTGCAWSGGFFGQCTATTQATNLPWTATAVTTTNIQIHGVNINLLFEGAGCSAAGAVFRITGTLTRADWGGNVNHEIILTPGVTGSSGLVSHSVLGNGVPYTLTGTIRDTQQTLTVTN